VTDVWKMLNQEWAKFTGSCCTGELKHYCRTDNSRCMIHIKAKIHAEEVHQGKVIVILNLGLIMDPKE
jgi:hypothetical protein